jgi:cytochrome c
MLFTTVTQWLLGKFMLGIQIAQDKFKMFNTKKTAIATALVAAMAASLTACGGEKAAGTTAAPVADNASIRYLDPTLHKMPTREEKKDPSNPYSAEVAGETGSQQCRTPKAFVEVWDSAKKNMESEHKTYGYGKPISESVMKGDWNLSALGDGTGMPPKEVGMTIEEGEVLYQKYCAACHGEFGEGNGHYLPLAGGPNTTKDDGGPMPVKTLFNYWPYATTFFDYARRAMPFFYPNHPDIGDAGYMGITGYVLMMNGYKDPEGNELSSDTFFNSELLMKVNEQVKAKNDVNFFCDQRPDVHNTRCGLNGDKCADEWVGNGKGDIHQYKEALINPVTNLPQYNNNQRH